MLSSALMWWVTVFLFTRGQPTPVHAYYVAPAPRGNASGNGTQGQPWDLATALAGGGGRIRAGDTVWLGGGRYPGVFQTQLRGERDRLIVFRQVPDARATIDGTLRAGGAFLAFWGFEIMQSNPLAGGYGLEAQTNGGRFINLVIHDVGRMGVSFWTPGEDAELYGCIVYNNGTHENRDHGVYVHNERGIKRLTDNIFFDNLAYGIHAYAGPKNPPQRGIYVEGNIAFNNGTISRRYRAKGNILVGGDVPMSAIAVLSNLLYFSGSEGTNLRLGYAPVGNEDVVARGNFIWGGETGLWLGQWQSDRVEGNTVGGARNLVAGPPLTAARQILIDAVSGVPPTTVFVRPNRYERGRAHIVAYNSARRAQLRADVSAVLRTGDRYELRSVQDLYGPPLARGTYTGDSISLPMTEPAALLAQPTGRPTATPPITRPLFDVFVLTRNAAATPSGTHPTPSP